MKRRTIALFLAVCCFGVVPSVLLFLYLSGYPFSYTTGTMTVNEFGRGPERWPSLWAGRRVSVHGIVEMRFEFIPEWPPPWNCMLKDPDGGSSVPVCVNSSLIDCAYGLEGKDVTVVGVAREDHRYGRDYLYIEAETVEPYGQHADRPTIKSSPVAKTWKHGLQSAAWTVL